MVTTEINSFREVILFEMQRSKKTILTFSEIWNTCETTKLPKERSSINFIRRMLCTIDMLDAEGIAIRHMAQGGQKISHIALTNAGAAILKNTIFTNQQAMGVHA
jgi:hypothetical protein